MELPAAFHEHPFFKSLSPEQTQTLMSIAAERRFEGGDTIVRQFDKQSDLMLVTHGNVCIKTFSGETIAELNPGSVLGEVSLVDEAPRSATAVAKGPATVMILPSSALRDKLSSDPDLKSAVIENVAKILCARLRAANIHLDAASGRH